MSRLAYYQKYRSNSFAEVIGQDYVVRSIQNAVRTGQVGHAYLFCGPRGTGKTTMARLLARAVNCENPKEAPCGRCDNCKAAMEGNHPDIIEINAANETHVEDIRDLIDRARLAPMLGRHKIYIIDEVHQLSSSAASALLKTLEEPPSHVIFILATTDPQKLLPTIISRCQRFDFGRVDRELIKAHLLDIAGREGFALEDGAAEKIAELADGGMRDSLSILEQTVSYSDGKVTEADINKVYGLASAGQKMDLLKDIFADDLAGVLNKISDYEASGIDLRRFTSELITVLRDGAVYAMTGQKSLLKVLNEEQAAQLSAYGRKDLLKMTEALMKALESYRNAQSVASCFEIACMDMMAASQVTDSIGNAPKKASRIIREPIPEPRAEQPAVQPREPEKPAPAAPAEDMHAYKKAEPAEEEPEPIEHEETCREEEQPAEQEPQAEMDTEPQPQRRELPQMTPEVIVQLLVQCDKDCKAADAARLQSLTGGFVMDRYVQTLRQVQLVASGPDCVVFGAGIDAVANTVNAPEFNRGLYEYLKKAGIDKMPFAVTSAVYKAAVEDYRQLYQQKNLPEKLEIHRYEQAEVPEQKVNPEEKMKQVFGEDLVEVIEEGKE